MISKCCKTNIPDRFKPLPNIRFCKYRKYRPEYVEASTLMEICGRVYDATTEPPYWNYTPEEIASLILESTGHPEYKEAFVKNNIDGKAIIFLEADKFPRISIRRFHIIKELTAKIRNLCKIDQDEFKRSISLPIRRPQTLYLWYKAKRTGPTAYYMTPTKYFKIIHVIPEEAACGRSYYALLNHWNRIPPFMPWCPHVMIGGNRRINPMTGTTQRQNLHPQNHPYLLEDHALCMYHFPCGFQFPVGQGPENKMAYDEPRGRFFKALFYQSFNSWDVVELYNSQQVSWSNCEFVELTSMPRRFDFRKSDRDRLGQNEDVT